MVSSEGMWFGRLAYEAPLGAHGLRIGAGVSRVSYELGGAFEILDAVGTADIYAVSLTYPLIRQLRHNLFLRVFAVRKELPAELRTVDFKPAQPVDSLGEGRACGSAAAPTRRRWARTACASAPASRACRTNSAVRSRSSMRSAPRTSTTCR